jgi:hypothetical protein
MVMLTRRHPAHYHNLYGVARRTASYRRPTSKSRDSRLIAIDRIVMIWGMGHHGKLIDEEHVELTVPEEATAPDEHSPNEHVIGSLP